MPRGVIETLPEVIFTDDVSRVALSAAAKEGRVVRVGPGMYVSGLALGR